MPKQKTLAELHLPRTFDPIAKLNPCRFREEFVQPNVRRLRHQPVGQ